MDPLTWAFRRRSLLFRPGGRGFRVMNGLIVLGVVALGLIVLICLFDLFY